MFCFWFADLWSCFFCLFVLLWFWVLLWFHYWVSGKVVDFGSQVRSVVFFVVSVLSVWVLNVCFLFDLGVHVIDLSPPLSNLFFAGCLPLYVSIVGHLLAMLGN